MIWPAPIRASRSSAWQLPVRLPSGRLWYAVQRAFYFTLISVGLELALGLLFAIVLNEPFAATCWCAWR